MLWNRKYIIKSYILNSFWLTPFLAVLAYWVVSRVTHGIGGWLLQTGRIDEATAFFGLSMAGARTMLDLNFLCFFAKASTVALAQLPRPLKEQIISRFKLPVFRRDGISWYRCIQCQTQAPVAISRCW